MFRPNQINELRTPAELLIPTTEDYLGTITKTYPETGKIIFVNFKSKGGTETTVNGVYSVLDTAEIVTWYYPLITAGCRIKIGSDLYEIKGTPEDVELQHMFMILKVERVGGGA